MTAIHPGDIVGWSKRTLEKQGELNRLDERGTVNRSVSFGFTTFVNVEWDNGTIGHVNLVDLRVIASKCGCGTCGLV